MFFKKKNKKEEIIKSEHDIIKEYKEKKQVYNYPVGSKVISRSNENEPYLIGVISSYIRITKENDLVPVINFGEDKEYVCFSIIRHYSEELCKILDKLSPKEQWNVLTEFNLKIG